ncbi:TRAP-type C4-dicarboxylate transport system permease small subunit [Rhizobium petrolearium]|uniref:TRAP transporter small permease n=1 Tax=Neorhizobium petrolearium TaxID=515361 RepID=UPI001AEA7E90|nr:TRAP transporter small permease [Neorhizobium petrolearium]MBP1845646.1 TRAP-type C4-dicarboxylate transport system permease small subunit [Neorhizobium petrolearium]
MKQAVDVMFRALDWLLVLLLAGMTIMVFGNVVLRYGFRSGIDISEEMSRFFFVWLIFLGSISAMRRNLHMGFDLLVISVGPRTRRSLLAIANALVLGCCVLILVGTIMQWKVNSTNIAPVSGLPMTWLFGVALPMSLFVGIMAAFRFVGYITGRLENVPQANAELHE